MNKIKLIYWRSDKFYGGKIQEYPRIMLQGETLEELLENIRDAFFFMVFDDAADN